MKTYHFYENNLDILHRLQDHEYHLGDLIRMKGRTGKIISILPIDNQNIKVNIKFEPKKSKIIPIDLKKLKRR